MKDMRTYTRAPEFLENERMFTAYPEMLTSFMTRMYDQTTEPKEHLVPTMLKTMKDCHISVFDLLKDMIEGARAL